MTTAQIIIITVLFLILASLTVYYFIKANKYNEIDELSLVFYFIVLILTFTIIITCFLNLRDLRKGCPELEKVENVYKIKE